MLLLLPLLCVFQSLNELCWCLLQLVSLCYLSFSHDLPYHPLLGRGRSKACSYFSSSLLLETKRASVHLPRASAPSFRQCKYLISSHSSPHPSDSMWWFLRAVVYVSSWTRSICQLPRGRSSVYFPSQSGRFSKVKLNEIYNGYSFFQSWRTVINLPFSTIEVKTLSHIDSTASMSPVS